MNNSRVTRLILEGMKPSKAMQLRQKAMQLRQRKIDEEFDYKANMDIPSIHKSAEIYLDNDEAIYQEAWQKTFAAISHIEDTLKSNHKYFKITTNILDYEIFKADSIYLQKIGSDLIRTNPDYICNDILEDISDSDTADLQMFLKSLNIETSNEPFADFDEEDLIEFEENLYELNFSASKVNSILASLK